MKTVYLSCSTKSLVSGSFLGALSSEIERLGFNVVSPYQTSSVESEVGYRSAIKRASLVLAVVEDSSPNVFVDIGCAIGAGRPLLVVVVGSFDLPFSLRFISSVQVEAFHSTAISGIIHRLAAERIEDSEPPQFQSYREALLAYRDEPGAFDMMGNEEFRNAVYEWCNSKGWKPELVEGPDYGCDFVLRQYKGYSKTLVVVKKYGRSSRVSVSHVQALLGVVYAHRADCGIIITTSEFTRSAVDFAGKYSPQLELWPLNAVLDRL